MNSAYVSQLNFSTGEYTLSTLFYLHSLFEYKKSKHTGKE